MKFKVISYRKNNALMPTNGGTLIITESEYIIKYLFITVARYKINKTLATKISYISKGIKLNDGEKEINLYFFLKNSENSLSIIKSVVEGAII